MGPAVVALGRPVAAADTAGPAALVPLGGLPTGGFVGRAGFRAVRLALK